MASGSKVKTGKSVRKLRKTTSRAARRAPRRRT